MSKNQVQSVSTVPMQFNSIFLAVTPDKTHDFLMSTEEVAKGYSVSFNSIHSHKKRHSDEILENTHFLSLTQNAGVNEMSIKKLYWTKRGVIRLGMFIKSQRAVKFRDWAENLILEKVEPMPTPKPKLKRCRDYELFIEEITEHWDKFDDFGKGLMMGYLSGYISEVQSFYLKSRARKAVL